MASIIIFMMLFFLFGFVLSLIGKNINNTFINITGILLSLYPAYKIYCIIENVFLGSFFDTFSAFFYLRDELNTKVSWLEAQQLSKLFTLNSSGIWYPMREIRNLPEAERKKTLFIFYKQLQDNNKI